MSWAGCYTLDLYCENSKLLFDGVHDFDEFPHQYTGEVGARCRAKARKAGWKIRGMQSWCPKCAPPKKQGDER